MNDDDHDGASNLHEYRADTKPRSAESVLRFAHLAGRLECGPALDRWRERAQVLYRAFELGGAWTPVFTTCRPLRDQHAGASHVRLRLHSLPARGGR
jgi:hypothetical protein